MIAVTILWVFYNQYQESEKYYWNLSQRDCRRKQLLHIRGYKRTHVDGLERSTQDRDHFFG
ncbi:hypothetical protein Plhal304r1_c085g0168991 [Plasmopara halstedii]